MTRTAGESRDERRAQPERVKLIAIVFVAALVRVFSLAAASTLPSFTHHRLDALLYHEAGQVAAAGDWTLGAGVLHMSPLYCYFLGAVYSLFGSGPWSARGVQLCLGLCTIVLTSFAARRMFGATAGLLGAGAVALYGPLIFYESQISLVTLATFLFALLVCASVRLLQTRAVGALAWAGLGLALGLCALARPNALLFSVPVAYACWQGTRTRPTRVRIACALALALTAIGTLAPVTLRNRIVGGEWVLVTDSGGLNFYLGNGPGANGTFRVPAELPDATNAEQQFISFRAGAERAAGHVLNSHAVDAHYYRLAFNEISTHPAHWLRLLAEKAWLFWNRSELPNTEDYAFNRVLNPVLGLPLLQFFVLAPLALLGVATLLWSRRDEHVVVALLIGVQFVALTAFFVLAHYRLPVVPALILAALAALEFLRDAVSTRSVRRLAAAAGVLLLALPLVFWPKLPKTFDDEWFKLGYAYQVEGDLQQAENAYLRALEINPDNISVHKNLATLYANVASTDRARTHWQIVWNLADRRKLPSYKQQAEQALRALP